MAQTHNSLQNAPEIPRAIERMFGQDQDIVVERLGETLQPVVDIWAHPYCAFLRGEVLCASSLVQGATAAELAFIAASNPVDSDVLLVITAAAVRTAVAADDVRLGIGLDSTMAANADATQVPIPRDSRFATPTGLVKNPVFRRGAYAATQITILERLRITAANLFTPAQALPVVLPPGRSLVFEHSAINVAMDANFVGFYKRLYKREL